MGKRKFYVIWKGKETGVFNSWETCKKNIDGFKGAEYKSFSDLASAEKAFSKNYEQYKGKAQPKVQLSKEQIALIGSPDMNTIAVDAACSGNPGLMEYQGVHTKTKEVILLLVILNSSTMMLF